MLFHSNDIIYYSLLNFMEYQLNFESFYFLSLIVYIHKTDIHRETNKKKIQTQFQSDTQKSRTLRALICIFRTIYFHHHLYIQQAWYWRKWSSLVLPRSHKACPNLLIFTDRCIIYRAYSSTFKSCYRVQGYIYICQYI